jgi:nucleoid DNA-binding protein
MMEIRFTIAKRGLLASEEAALKEAAEKKAALKRTSEKGTAEKNAAEKDAAENNEAEKEAADNNEAPSNEGAVVDERWLRSLRPQVEHRSIVDVVDFQSSEFRLSSTLSRGELTSALSVIQEVMVHELEKGNAVTLPYIGTFRLSLKGGIEVKNGYYHGRDVRVDDLLFRPNSELLGKVRSIKVNQVPYGQAFHIEDDDMEERLTALFAQQSTITHMDVSYAFGQTLTRSRISALLRRLVGEGRLIRVGRGAQTRYRAASGQFGR